MHHACGSLIRTTEVEITGVDLMWYIASHWIVNWLQLCSTWKEHLGLILWCVLVFFKVTYRWLYWKKVFSKSCSYQFIERNEEAPDRGGRLPPRCEQGPPRPSRGQWRAVCQPGGDPGLPDFAGAAHGACEVGRGYWAISAVQRWQHRGHCWSSCLCDSLPDVILSALLDFIKRVVCAGFAWGKPMLGLLLFCVRHEKGIGTLDTALSSAWSLNGRS